MNLKIENDKGSFEFELQKDGGYVSANFTYNIKKSGNEFSIIILCKEYNIELNNKLDCRLYYNMLNANNQEFSSSVFDMYRGDIMHKWEEKYPPKYKFLQVQNLNEKYKREYDITKNKYITYEFYKDKQDEILTIDISQERLFSNSSTSCLWSDNYNLVVLPFIEKYLQDNKLSFNKNSFLFIDDFEVSIKVDKTAYYYQNRIAWKLVLENNTYEDIKVVVDIDSTNFIKILTKYINKKYKIGNKHIYLEREEFLAEYLKKYYKDLINQYTELFMNYFNGTFNIVKKYNNKNYVCNKFSLNHRYNKRVYFNDSEYKGELGYDFVKNTNMVELYFYLKNNKFGDTEVVAHLTKYISIEELCKIVKIEFGIVSYNNSETFSLTSYGEKVYLQLLKEMSNSFNLNVEESSINNVFKNKSNCIEVFNDDQKWKYINETLIGFSCEGNKANIKFQYDINGNMGIAEQDFEGDDLLNQIYKFIIEDKTFNIIKHKINN